MSAAASLWGMPQRLKLRRLSWGVFNQHIWGGYDRRSHGCGNGSISAWLAERVGPGGSAVALDLDLSLVDARAPRLELRQGDIVAGPVRGVTGPERAPRSHSGQRGGVRDRPRDHRVKP